MASALNIQKLAIESDNMLLSLSAFRSWFLYGNWEVSASIPDIRDIGHMSFRLIGLEDQPTKCLILGAQLSLSDSKPFQLPIQAVHLHNQWFICESKSSIAKTDDSDAALQVGMPSIRTAQSPQFHQLAPLALKESLPLDWRANLSPIYGVFFMCDI